MVGDRALIDDIADLVEDANRVLLVAEVESDGDGWDEVVHGSRIVDRASSAGTRCLLI